MRANRIWIVGGLLLFAGLALGGLLGPAAPRAYELPRPPAPPVAISAAGDSAWAIVGNRVYYVTLRNRSEVTGRTIFVIGSKELK